MGNLENAKDLGQSIYTKAEVNVDFAHKVSSIAGLASLGSSTPTVIVTDIDRGGIFVWSASGTANGGTVFAGSSGYWVRQYSGAVNVKWFGAKGDGVTDDTTAIQSVLNYISIFTGIGGVNKYNNNEKFTLYFPTGNYKIEDTLTIAQCNNVEILGDGKLSTSIIQYTINKDCFQIGNITTPDWNNGYDARINIRNISFNGSTLVETGNGLVVHGIDVTIDSCGFYNNGKIGLWCTSTGYGNVTNSSMEYNKVGAYLEWAVWLNNCHVTKNRLAGVIAINDITISNSLIEWQCPITGCGDRLIGILSANNSEFTKNTLDSMYFEHDYTYFGYPYLFDSQTCSFTEGSMRHIQTNITNSKLSDQSRMFLQEGEIKSNNNHYLSNAFAFATTKTATELTAYNAIYPTISSVNDTALACIGVGFSSIQGSNTNLILNPTFKYNYSTNTGVSTTVNNILHWSVEANYFASGNFKASSILTQETLPNGLLTDTIKFSIVISPTSTEYPKLASNIFKIQKGIRYFVFFNYKSNAPTFVVCRGKTSNTSYGSTGYVIAGQAFTYLSLPVATEWSSACFSFTASMDEMCDFMMQTINTIGSYFNIANINIGSSPSSSISNYYLDSRAKLSAAPTTGSWSLNDIIYNTAPTAGGFAGWICTTAGTPGTWKTFGAITA